MTTLSRTSRKTLSSIEKIWDMVLLILLVQITPPQELLISNQLVRLLKDPWIKQVHSPQQIVVVSIIKGIGLPPPQKSGRCRNRELAITRAVRMAAKIWNWTGRQWVNLPMGRKWWLEEFHKRQRRGKQWLVPRVWRIRSIRELLSRGGEGAHRWLGGISKMWWMVIRRQIHSRCRIRIRVEIRPVASILRHREESTRTQSATTPPPSKKSLAKQDLTQSNKTSQLSTTSLLNEQSTQLETTKSP